MKALATCGAAALLAVLPLFAEAGAIDRLHRFLAGTKTLKAEFEQVVVATGGRKPQPSSGLVSIARPGKLRWEIVKPYPQLVVGDGEKFWIYDSELQQVTVRRVGQAIVGSPAALLAGSNDLERNFALAEAGEREGLFWVDAVPRGGDSGFERVRIGFAGDDLKAMELRDSFGQTTLIRFSALERNPALPAATFRFVPPAGVDVVGE
ncbi:MAG: outer membrane lipoprotein chaperone LolA [Betaproteobacteria bacterium]|nr:outer membrane lipoprotein chaperone LolA [Betaproteobacteria bacterium]